MSTEPELLVQITERYRRSVHLAADFGDPAALAGYVVTPMVAETANRIIDGLRAADGSRAWTLVGPYGSGKSSFLVLLASLLSGGDEREAALSRGLTADSALPACDESYLTVLVTGEHVDLRYALLAAVADAAEAHFATRLGRTPKVVGELRAAVIAAADGRPPRDSQIVELIGALAAKATASKSGPVAGVTILVDEMGKLVEWAAMQRGSADIYILQLLAEAAARAAGAKICVVTTLHQSLDAYAEGLPKAARTEWAKIGGRFESIPFVEAPRHITRLVAAAIETNRAFEESDVATDTHRLVDEVAKCAQLDDEQVALLKQCAPLHPLTTLVLGPLFRSKLGQNERSLFAFLASQEPGGFQSYLRGAQFAAAKPYTLAALYDYVVANTGVRVVGGEVDRTWAATEQALQRLPESSEALDVALLKSVAILGVAGSASGIRASDAVLVASVDATPKEVRAALKRLTGASILVYRNFRESYQVWDGSDLNIAELVASARRRVAGAGGFAERLEAMFPPLPIVAARHYHRTGTLRYLVPCYSGVVTTVADWPQTRQGDGDLVCVIPDQASELAVARSLAVQPDAAREEGGRPRVIALPADYDGLLRRVLDLLAIDEVLSSTPELAGDPIARRELQNRRLNAVDLVSEALSLSFTLGSQEAPLNWIADGTVLEHQGRATSLASELFDRAYAAAPVVHNELINRQQPSSAAAAARRILLERLFTHAEVASFGIEGTPPERSLYRSVFEAGALHQQRGDHWQVSEPPPTSTFAEVWRRLDDYFERQPAKRVAVGSVLSFLESPPIGLRAGLSPIVLLAYYKTRESTLFMYEDNTFLPRPADDVVPRILKRPDSFEIQRATAVAEIDSTVRALGAKLLPDHENVSVLDLVRAIVEVVMRLSSYASNTQNLSENARRVRSAIKSARDPIRLVVEQLPNALGCRTTAGKIQRQYPSSLKHALDELMLLDNALLGRIDSSIRRFFDAQDPPSERFYVELRARAATLDGREFVPQSCRNFVAVSATAAPEEVGQPPYFDRVGTAIVGKPPKHWTDADLQQFEYRALEVARGFVAAEDLHLALSKQDNASVPLLSSRPLRVSILGVDGVEHHGVASARIDDLALDGALAKVRATLSAATANAATSRYLLTMLLAEQLRATPSTTGSDD